MKNPWRGPGESESEAKGRKSKGKGKGGEEIIKKWVEEERKRKVVCGIMRM